MTADTALAIIFHGTNDTIIPYHTAKLFGEKMRIVSNRCELVSYVGATHDFFNYGQGDNAAFVDSVNKMDGFLVSLVYLNSTAKVYRGANFQNKEFCSKR